MTALRSYSTGTVSVSTGDTTVIGVGTIWSGVNARPGDMLQIGSVLTVVTDVADVDRLAIPPWGGANQAGVAYNVWQVSPQRFAGAQAAADVQTLVGALNASGFFHFVGAALNAPDPSLGTDGQYAMQPTTGKTWFKVGGVWTYLGIYKGLNFRGPYDSAATFSLGDVVSSNGSSYVWINATPGSGHAPPNLTYWQVLSSSGAGYGGSSASSLTIRADGVGQNFQTQLNLAYLGGNRVRVNGSAAGTAGNWMEGQCDYNPANGIMTIYPDSSAGAGTFTAWNIQVAGQKGAPGTPAANYGGTSASSVTVGTGVLTFATQAELAYQTGARVRATSTANSSVWVEGVCAYTPTTGILQINVDKTNGAGTVVSWNLNVAGQPGAGDMSSGNYASEYSGNLPLARGNLGLRISPDPNATFGAGVDANLMISPGDLTINSPTNSNFPLPGVFWFLKVSVYPDPNYIKQTATRLDNPGDGRIWERVRVGGTWYPWRKVITQEYDYKASENNILVNPNFEVTQQYGPNNVANMPSNQIVYIADAWRMQASFTTGAYITNHYNAAGGPDVGANYVSIAASSVTNPINASDYVFMIQAIEGNRIAKLNWGSAAAKPVVIGFWYTATNSGRFSISVRNGSFDRSYVTSIPVTGSAGWQYAAVVIPGCTTGTWPKDNSAAMYVGVALMAGPSWQTASKDTWISGSSPGYLAANDQTNMFNTASSYFFFARSFMIAGDAVPAAETVPLLQPNYADALQTCKRYYEKSYNQAVVPGTANAAGAEIRVVPGNSVGPAQDYGSVEFTVNKRANPTVTVYGYAGTLGAASNQSGGDVAGAGTAVGISENRFSARNGANSWTTTGFCSIFQWVADARI